MAVKGYRFDIDCPRDGAELEHRAGGTSTGLTTRAVAYCPQCRDEWVIELTVRSEHVQRQADNSCGQRWTSGKTLTTVTG